MVDAVVVEMGRAGTSPCAGEDRFHVLFTDKLYRLNSLIKSKKPNKMQSAVSPEINAA